MPYKPSRIVVLGGAQGMGRWMIDKVFLPQQYRILVYDTNKQALSHIPDSPLLERMELEESPLPEAASGFQSIGPQDAVVIAVPLDKMEALVRQLLPVINTGTFVFDVGSVKTNPLRWMKEACDAGRISVAGTHPLFAPSVADPVGQIVVVCRCEYTQEEHLVWLRHCLESVDLICPVETPDLHDRAMLYAQVITHLAYLAFAKTLADTDVRFAKLIPFRTPPFTFLSAFAGRIMGSSPGVYANIQTEHGDEAKAVRAEFIKAASELTRVFDECQVQKSADAIREVTAFWEHADVGECQAIAQFAIAALQGFERRLHDLCHSRKLCILRRLDATKRMHVGFITHIEADCILFQENALLMKNGQYAVPVNEYAVKAYRKRGIHLPKGEPLTIKKRFFEILSESEERAWIEEHAYRTDFELSVSSPIALKTKVLESWVPRICEGVRKCTVIDSYRRGDEPFRIRLCLDICAHIDWGETKRTIEDFISNIVGTT